MRTPILATLAFLTITPAFADSTDCGPSVDVGAKCTVQIKAGTQTVLYMQPGENPNNIVAASDGSFRLSLVKGGSGDTETTAVAVTATQPDQKGSVLISTDRGFRDITLVSE